MALKAVFRRSPMYNVSYDFIDIATGTGYRTFYGASENHSAGNGGSSSSDTYILTADSTLFSNTQNVTITNTRPISSWTKFTDIDFDLSPFNIPQTVDGICTIQYTISGSANIANTQQCQATFKIRKWDGTTETDIATIYGEMFGDGLTRNIFSDDVTCVAIGDIPATKFSSGDILRVTFEGWGTNDGASNWTWTFSLDPANRKTTQDTTQFKIYMPFRIYT